MIDTQASSGIETETPIRLNWDLIDERCAALGATTGADRARLLGAGRAQLYRWRDGTNDIGLARAAGLAARVGLTLSGIVAADPKPSHPPGQPKPPAGPGNPKPPAGPKEGK